MKMKTLAVFSLYILAACFMGCCISGNVNGIWYNQLGSTMELTQSEYGVLSGVYCNKAPNSSTDKEKLVGSIGRGVPATLGFVVNYEEGLFTASWSGQYFNAAGVDKKEVILTTWILTSNQQGYDEYWKSTNVGQDRFTREPQKAKGRKSLAVQYLKKQMK